MPQMAPILWLPLFSIILMVLILLMMNLYFFNKLPSKIHASNLSTHNPLHWPW
uniref:ATP synthase complex subunit 8 n=1 Tax=Epimeria cornigera TaxID=1582882 RepID=A0A2S1TMB4_9CRUS|nr:ATP synthase F0 subunit 8 [Epimeria cornigera]